MLRQSHALWDVLLENQPETAAFLESLYLLAEVLPQRGILDAVEENVQLAADHPPRLSGRHPPLLGTLPVLAEPGAVGRVDVDRLDLALQALFLGEAGHDRQRVAQDTGADASSGNRQLTAARHHGRVRRRDLIRVIERAARKANFEWELVRQGADHELWSLDGERVTVPRHREINEVTARGILKALETKLGQDWWRK